jgi:hypothetical protein
LFSSTNRHSEGRPTRRACPPILRVS